jgi:hypothetical protein
MVQFYIYIDSMSTGGCSSVAASSTIGLARPEVPGGLMKTPADQADALNAMLTDAIPYCAGIPINRPDPYWLCYRPSSPNPASMPPGRALLDVLGWSHQTEHVQKELTDIPSCGEP